jgi:hypothetical protein
MDNPIREGDTVIVPKTEGSLARWGTQGVVKTIMDGYALVTVTWGGRSKAYPFKLSDLTKREGTYGH